MDLAGGFHGLWRAIIVILQKCCKQISVRELRTSPTHLDLWCNRSVSGGAVAINAAWMQTYVKGVSCPIVCNKKALNHGVLLVGFGASELALSRLKKMPFWIIKNSWGAAWGEQGFYKICSGRNMCGVQSMVSSVVATSLKAGGEEAAVATA